MSPSAAIRSSSEQQRPGALAPREDVVLEEVAVGEPPVELLVGEEPVVHAVRLARPLRARRRRDGEPEPRDAASSACTIVPLPAPDGPVRTKTGPLPVEEANQLLALAVGEAADRLRLADAALVEQARAFTRPNLGTAMSMSKTFAVETYSGGSARICSIETRPT